ncbi:hypothetical protein [Undibacterium sp. Ji22W]|uniref:hypothetical protein n=1 Tax=Undibacterium sp. Ji22W TaxID=3413038 RepID=UPI003BF0BACD
MRTLNEIFIEKCEADGVNIRAEFDAAKLLFRMRIILKSYIVQVDLIMHFVGAKAICGDFQIHETGADLE